MKYFYLILLLLPLSVFAADEEKMYSFTYLVEQNDTLASIFRRFVYPQSVITKKTPMTQKTLSENSHVQNWDELVTGTKLKLFINESYLDMEKYNKYQEELADRLGRIKRQHETENGMDENLPEGLKASVFYMASSGKFTQKYPEAKVDYYQNSPATLGTSLSYYPKNTKWSFSGSAYFSYLLATASNIQSSQVQSPLEIGGNLYTEYRFDNFTGYFGIDYEKFSTFNIKGLTDENPEILLDTNRVTYATVGLAKLVHIFNTPIFTKLSFSKSIVSEYEAHEKSDLSDQEYEGYKILWYLNKKFNNRLFIHSLVKYHSMDGDSELSTLRIGVGFGYILF
jgi:hypothetical protein